VRKPPPKPMPSPPLNTPSSRSSAHAVIFSFFSVPGSEPAPAPMHSLRKCPPYFLGLPFTMLPCSYWSFMPHLPASMSPCCVLLSFEHFSWLFFTQVPPPPPYPLLPFSRSPFQPQYAWTIGWSTRHGGPLRPTFFAPFGLGPRSTHSFPGDNRPPVLERAGCLSFASPRFFQVVFVMSSSIRRVNLFSCFPSFYYLTPLPLSAASDGAIFPRSPRVRGSPPPRTERESYLSIDPPLQSFSFLKCVAPFSRPHFSPCKIPLPASLLGSPVADVGPTRSPLSTYPFSPGSECSFGISASPRLLARFPMLYHSLRHVVSPYLPCPSPSPRRLLSPHSSFLGRRAAATERSFSLLVQSGPPLAGSQIPPPSVEVFLDSFPRGCSFVTSLFPFSAGSLSFLNQVCSRGSSPLFRFSFQNPLVVDTRPVLLFPRPYPLGREIPMRFPSAPSVLAFFLFLFAFSHQAPLAFILH